MGGDGGYGTQIGKSDKYDPEFWLNLQRDVDIYQAHLKLKDELQNLQVLRAAKPESELAVDLPVD